MDRTAATFVRVWTQFQPQVRRYVFTLVPRPADADDVLQETATSLWEKFDRYDPQQPFVAWAIRFAHLEILKWRQRQARDRLVFSDELIERLHAAATEEAPLLEVRRHALDGCLQALPTEDRDLLVRRYARHGSMKSESERSGLSVHKLYYAVEQIRARLMACVERTMQKEGWVHG